MHCTSSTLLCQSLHLSLVQLTRSTTNSTNTLTSRSLLDNNDEAINSDNMYRSLTSESTSTSSSPSTIVFSSPSHKLHASLLQLMRNREVQKQKQWLSIHKSFSDNKNNYKDDNYESKAKKIVKNTYGENSWNFQRENTRSKTCKTQQEAEIISEEKRSEHLLYSKCATSITSSSSSSSSLSSTLHDGTQQQYNNEYDPYQLSPVNETSKSSDMYRHDLLIELLFRERAKRNKSVPVKTNSDYLQNTFFTNDNDNRNVLRNVHVMKVNTYNNRKIEEKKEEKEEENNCKNESHEEKGKTSVADVAADNDDNHHHNKCKESEWHEVYETFLQHVTLAANSSNNTSYNNSKSVVCPTIYHVNILMEYALLLSNSTGFDDVFDFYDRFASAVNELRQEKINLLLMWQYAKDNNDVLSEQQQEEEEEEEEEEKDTIKKGEVKNMDLKKRKKLLKPKEVHSSERKNEEELELLISREQEEESCAQI